MSIETPVVENGNTVVAAQQIGGQATLDSVMTLDNCKVIPSVPDHISQRGNYIVLIERILTEEIA